MELFSTQTRATLGVLTIWKSVLWNRVWTRTVQSDYGYSWHDIIPSGMLASSQFELCSHNIRVPFKVGVYLWVGVRGTVRGVRSVRARSRQHRSSRHACSLAALLALEFICVGPGSTPRCPSGTPSMSPQKRSPAVDKNNNILITIRLNESKESQHKVNVKRNKVHWTKLAVGFYPARLLSE